MASVSKEFILSIFDKIDTDGNGDISEAELVGTFKAFDTDGDSCVSKAEFNTAFQSTFNATGAQADKVFVKLDKDGDGNLDLNELAVFFKDMDKNGDGSVNRDEFLQYWSNLLSS